MGTENRLASLLPLDKGVDDRRVDDAFVTGAVLRVDRQHFVEEATLAQIFLQNLAGTFSLDTSTGTLTATSGSKTVTIGKSVKEIKAFDDYLYIAIAPGSYTNFKVRAKWMDFNDEKTEASITFTAGKIYDMGEFYPQP